MKSLNVDKIILYFVLASFSFVLMNLVHTSTHIYIPQFVAELICLVLFIFKYNSLDKTAKLSILLLASCLLQAIINPNSFRTTTVIYSGLFIVVFIVYRQLLDKRFFTFENFVKWTKIAIYIYTVFLLIQQAQSLLGLSIFNYHSDGISKFKLNSLTWESSNLALIVPAYFFAFIKCREIQRKRKYDIKKDFLRDWKIWFCFCYSTLTCASMSGFIAVTITMCYFINKKNIWYVAIGAVIAISLVPLLSIFSIFDVGRLKLFFGALIEFNPNVLVQVDASAACRVIPYWVYFSSINPFDVSFLLGHGIDQAESIAKHMIIFDHLDRNIGATNITSFFFNYGIIPTILFASILKKSISSRWLSFEMFFYVALFSIVSFNHHVLWLFFILMNTVKFFKDQDQHVLLK